MVKTMAIFSKKIQTKLVKKNKVNYKIYILNLL